MIRRPLLPLLALCTTLSAALPLPASGVTPPGRGRLQIDEERFGREAIRRTIEKQVEARGRSLSIAASVSELEVRPSADDRIHLTARLAFWSNVPEWMAKVEEFDVEIDEDGGEVAVRVELPEFKARGHNAYLHYELELDVSVPRSTPLEIENRFGTVDVAGVGGPAVIHNNSGDVRLTGARGPVELEGRFGAMHVTDLEGDVRLDNASGAVEVRDVRGRVELQNRFGDVVLAGISGDVEARSQSGGMTATDLAADADLGTSFGDLVIEGIGGALVAVAQSGGVRARDARRGAEIRASFASVEAEDIGGPLDVTVQSGSAKLVDVAGRLSVNGSFGDVEARKVGGPAVISVSSGSVTVDDVQGDAEIGCTFGTVRARRVAGSLTVTGQSTAVSATQIARGARVETSFGGVTLDGVGGGIEVRVQSGAVTVTGLTGEALTAEHRVDASFGDIRFAWPEGQGAELKLEATMGSIVTDLPVRVRESGSRRVGSGTVGDGRARIVLAADSGSVTVESVPR